MAITLAFVEATAVFGAAYTTLVLWAHPLLADWTEGPGLLGQAAALSLSCLAAFYDNALYDVRTMRSPAQFVSRLPKSFCIALLLMMCGAAWFPRIRISVAPLIASLFAIFGTVLLCRAAAYGGMRRYPFTKRVLVLGATPLAQSLIRELEAQPRCTVVGVVDDAMPTGWPQPSHPLLGPLRQLDKLVEEVRPDRIIVALTERRGQLPGHQLLASRVKGIVVEDGLEVYERLTGKLAIESLTSSNLIFSKDFRKSRLDLALGRALSLLVSVVGLITCAPLFFLIALAIKLDSPGPVFFLQNRVGLGGRRFNLTKFRTMQPTPEPASEWAKDNGDRITRVGRWLRKFRLDELPQFVNILRGDMNVVGPRPHPVSNLDLLVLVSRNVPERGESIPYYSLRSMVRPGVTGWAQVRYRYANDIDEEIEKMRYDLYYIKHLSIWLDLRILFMTVKIVLMGNGAGVDDTDRSVAPQVVRKSRDFVKTG